MSARNGDPLYNLSFSPTLGPKLHMVVSMAWKPADQCPLDHWYYLQDPLPSASSTLWSAAEVVSCLSPSSVYSSPSTLSGGEGQVTSNLPSTYSTISVLPESR